MLYLTDPVKPQSLRRGSFVAFTPQDDSGVSPLDDRQSHHMTIVSIPVSCQVREVTSVVVTVVVTL